MFWPLEGSLLRGQPFAEVERAVAVRIGHRKCRVGLLVCEWRAPTPRSDLGHQDLPLVAVDGGTRVGVGLPEQLRGELELCA
jgi:hypothetical protein